METHKSILYARNYFTLRGQMKFLMCIPIKSINITEAKQTGGFNFFPIAAEKCKCSCNDVIWASVVGFLVFIIIGLIFYIVWLHKKGTTIFTFYNEFLSLCYMYTVSLQSSIILIFVSQVLLENKGRMLLTCGINNSLPWINSSKKFSQRFSRFTTCYIYLVSLYSRSSFDSLRYKILRASA